MDQSAVADDDHGSTVVPGAHRDRNATVNARSQDHHRFLFMIKNFDQAGLIEVVPVFSSEV